MIRNTFDKEPAPLNKSLLRNFHNHEIDLNGRKVWTISPKVDKSDLVILFLHGGGYMGNILKLHWD
jgi:acetyl esterase/lipase